MLDIKSIIDEIKAERPEITLLEWDTKLLGVRNYDDLIWGAAVSQRSDAAIDSFLSAIRISNLLILIFDVACEFWQLFEIKISEGFYTLQTIKQKELLPMNPYLLQKRRRGGR